MTADEVRARNAALDGELRALEDGHVGATMRNRTYGEEPFAAYLDRYLLGHEQAHAEQLRRTLAAVAGGS